MGWVIELQNRISSLYSNITFINTNDEKRIEEVVEMVKKGIRLNMTLPIEFDKIYFIDGANNFKVIMKENGWKTQIIEVDEFEGNPLKIYLQSNPQNSLLILYRFLNLDENIQSLLLSIARDTEFMNSNHILIFTENINEINNILLNYSNIIDAPLSLPHERKTLIEDFLNQVSKIKQDIVIIDDADAVVRATSGLNLMQFESLLYEGFIQFVIKENKGIPSSWFTQRKVEMINRNGTFRLVHPEYGLEAFASPTLIKDYIQRRIINVIKNYEKAKEVGLKYPDGLLLFGMQGTGKTWLARAIAKEINVPFMEFNISSVMSKYYGETERNVEKMIKILEAIQPAVLFIDEIDAIGLRRTGIETDSGVTRRTLNRLMSWLAEDKQVLVIGSTNRPEQMDDAFIRSGRFSFKIPLLLPDTETRKEIFKIHLNLRKANYENIDFDELSRKSRFYTGADIVKVVDDALFFAFEKDGKLDMECFDNAFKEILVDTNHNRELQKEYINYAEKFGTNKKIVEIYKSMESENEVKKKVDLIKSVVRG